MSSRSLDGSFDVVLNLGILYHLPNPLEALELTKSLAKSVILLDTGIAPTNQAILRLRWEEPDDIRRASKAGIVAHSSRSAIELMLRHIGVAEWYEIPIRDAGDMPTTSLIRRMRSYYSCEFWCAGSGSAARSTSDPAS